jgi:hypothetical protein
MQPTYIGSQSQVWMNAEGRRARLRRNRERQNLFGKKLPNNTKKLG